MCQTTEMFDGTPRLENLFDPAARSVPAGTSSPPWDTAVARARARAIEHEFDDPEVAARTGMSESGVVEAILEGFRRADEQLLERQRSLRALWERYVEKMTGWSLGNSLHDPSGVRKAPESRAGTAPWHYSGYGSAPRTDFVRLLVPVHAVEAVPRSSFGPGVMS